MRLAQDEAFENTVRLGALFLPDGRLLAADRLECRSCGLVGAVLHGAAGREPVVVLTQFDAENEDHRDLPPWVCPRCQSRDVAVERGRS